MERTYLIGKSHTAFLLTIRLQQPMRHGIRQFNKGVSPTVGPNGNLVYDIPYPEVGLQGGIPGAAAGHPILDSVRIVTSPGGANKVVTSFPK